MAETIFTNEQRAAIARAWPDSGLTQEQCSAQHGIKPRTLRQWLRRWPRVQYGVEREARAILEKAIAALKALLDSLAATPACLAASRTPEQLAAELVVEEPPRGSAVGGEVHGELETARDFWTP